MTTWQLAIPEPKMADWVAYTTEMWFSPHVKPRSPDQGVGRWLCPETSLSCPGTPSPCHHMGLPLCSSCRDTSPIQRGSTPTTSRHPRDLFHGALSKATGVGGRLQHGCSGGHNPVNNKDTLKWRTLSSPSVQPVALARAENVLASSFSPSAFMSGLSLLFAYLWTYSCQCSCVGFY